ncbi:MAG: type II secretion system secretin GspD [Clostridia bacterium]|nr:type II secretion system secretin GspD [Deltaproteobacteria bacterium]
MVPLFFASLILAQAGSETPPRPRNLPRTLPFGSGLRGNRTGPPPDAPAPEADTAADDPQAPSPAPAATSAIPSPTPAVPPRSAVAPVKEKVVNAEVDLADRQKNGRFNFEFSKADIMDVVKAISNLTQRNFIVPEKIKTQKITILSPGQISAAEAYQVFLASLESNGITVVRSGRFYKLVESKDSIKSPIPTCIGEDDSCPENTDQMITVLIRLSYVDGQQMNAVLKSLVGKDGDIQMFTPSNAMIISDYARNLQRIKRIIASLDVPGFQDELQIVDVEYAVASEISDKLSQIFEVSARGATAAGNTARPNGVPPRPSGADGNPAPGADGDSNVQISKIVADDRTNQIIIKANKQSFDAIRRLIAKLDIPIADTEQGRVHVYYLENASAEELASTLSALASGNPSSTRAGSGQGNGNRQGAPPTPPGTTGNNTNRQGNETATFFEGDVKITSDKATNSLLVLASGRDFRQLRRIIEQLDIPRRQVYVEAAIMEVSVDNTGSFGTNWHVPTTFGADDLPGGVGGPGSLGFFQNPGNGSVSPTLTDLSNPANLLSIASGSVVGLVGKAITIPVGDNSLTLPSFGIVLKALQTSSNVQVLSTPHILTMDNEEASIEVGRKIPFRRGTSIPATGLAGLGSGASGASGALASLGGASSLFSSVDRIDVTLKLTITPQINESDRIRLEIDQDIEDVASTDPTTQTPITSKRQAKTTVVVDDQQTIIIGGLMRDNTTLGESKIPILGDIPVLGWLFKTKTTSTQKINLILVLTPYIVRSADDFQHILERKVREYEEFAAEYYGSTPKYRAYIDYRKKTGPFARLAQAVNKAKFKAENGGADPNDSMVRPDRSRARPGETAPGQDTGVSNDKPRDSLQIQSGPSTTDLLTGQGLKTDAPRDPPDRQEENDEVSPEQFP